MTNYYIEEALNKIKEITNIDNKNKEKKIIKALEYLWNHCVEISDMNNIEWGDEPGDSI